MRAFVRITSTETVLTLDLPSSTTVRTLKQAVLESGQVPADVAASGVDLCLRLHSRCLPDSATLVAVYASDTPQHVEALHLVLCKSCDIADDRRQHVTPRPGAVRVPLDIHPSILCAEGCDPAVTIELRGWMDQKVQGRTSFDASTGQLQFKPTGTLLPGRTYSVVVHTGADVAWQFVTAELTPVRVLLEQCKRNRTMGDEPTRLITLQRQAGLLSELQAVARSTFGELDTEFRFTRPGCASGSTLDDVGVSLLQEGDVVRCSSMGAAPTLVVHDDVAPLSHEAYRREHWVNAASGYYAVGGKMSARDEEALLLAVVAAFEDEFPQSHPTMAVATDKGDLSSARGPTAGATGVASLAKEPLPSAIDGIEVVPPSQIEVRWGSHRAPRCCSLNEPDQLLRTWRASGFAVIELPPHTQAAVGALCDAWTAFCALPREEKEAAAETRAYLGYHYRPHFCKELLQLRGGAAAADAFPTAAATLHAAAESAYDALAQTAAEALRIACAAMGMRSEKIAALLEPSLAQQRTRTALSQSNLTMFRYSPALGDPDAVKAAGGVTPEVHCPYHTDVGLITLIPRGTSPGLHVFDVDTESGHDGWVDIEAGMPQGHAVLMGGESLHRLSNHWLLPGIHQVAYVAAERISAPFQLLAAPDALLDSSALDADVVGSPQPACDGPEAAAEFVQRVSAARVSSNFPGRMEAQPQAGSD